MRRSKHSFIAALTRPPDFLMCGYHLHGIFLYALGGRCESENVAPGVEISHMVKKERKAFPRAQGSILIENSVSRHRGWPPVTNGAARPERSPRHIASLFLFNDIGRQPWRRNVIAVCPRAKAGREGLAIVANQLLDMLTTAVMDCTVIAAPSAATCSSSRSLARSSISRSISASLFGSSTASASNFR